MLPSLLLSFYNSYVHIVLIPYSGLFPWVQTFVKCSRSPSAIICVILIFVNTRNGACAYAYSQIFMGWKFRDWNFDHENNEI